MNSQKRNKILHIIPELGIGGAEGMLLRLIGSKKSAEEHVLISLRRDDKNADRFLSLGIKVYFLNMSFFPSPRVIWSCFRIIKQERPSLVSTWLYLGDLVGTLSCLFLKNAPPIIWNIRCSDAQDKDWRLPRWMVSKLLSILSPLADKIVCNSQKGIDYHKRIGYQNKHWYLVPNGFDTELYKPNTKAREELRRELGIPLDAHVIGIVARYDRLKDYPTFLTAAKEFQIKRPQTHFVLVGEGIAATNAALAPYLKEFVSLEKVHLLGKRADVANLLSAFDIFTLTSLSEGFPNVIGEAMATEVFCVATDVGASKEILGETGYLIQPQNINQLKDAWEKALTMPASERLKQRAESRKRIQERYSLANIIKSYRNIYLEMMDTTSSF